MTVEEASRITVSSVFGTTTIADLWMTQDERDIAEAMRELDAEFPGYKEYGEDR